MVTDSCLHVRVRTAQVFLLFPFFPLIRIRGFRGSVVDFRNVSQSITWEGRGLFVTILCTKYSLLGRNPQKS